MKELIIVGARGWGREVLWASRTYENDGYIKIKGFLDSDPTVLDGLRGDFPPILCAPEDYEVQPDDIFFVALGDPIQRHKYYNIIKEKGGEFGTYISPKATVSPNATIGAGSFIDEYVSISDNAEVGEQCIVQRMTTLGHDVKVGSFSTIGANCFCGGQAKVGDFTTVNVASTILRHVNVGSNAVVGAGSVVIKGVNDGEHVFGNPAKRIF